MKRSRSVRLVLLGAAGVSLAACGDGEPVGGSFFTSEAECRRQLDAADCQRGAEEARVQHQRNAPRFETLAACQEQFGAENCQQAPQVASAEGAQAQPGQPQQQTQQRSGGGFFFWPIMHGFMMNRAQSGSGFAAQPVMRDRSGTALTATPFGTSQVGRFSGNAPSSFVSNAPRGGFGSSGRARSGGS